MRNLTSATVLAVGFSLAGLSSAYAAVAQCPPVPAPVGARIFTINTTEVDPPPLPTCLAFAAGNISGSGDAINALGWTTVDKSDNATLYENGDGELTITGGPNSGGFSFTALAGFEYVLALKSGSGGDIDPDWAAFQLNGATSGTWTISVNGFSHANLYYRRCEVCPPDRDISPVPLPAPIFMMLATLLSLGIYGWWRRRRVTV